MKSVAAINAHPSSVTVMKHTFWRSQIALARFLAVCSLLTFFISSVHATTSPYVTTQTDVPLNQSTNDNVNGLLPYFNSHEPLEGSIASISDATSSDAPTDNVIAGPDNTWIGIAWDLGDPGADFMWRLDRVDIWIAAGDNLRKGYRADLSVSSTGNVDDFAVIPNSQHWDGLTQNSQYNYVRYDFPDAFVAGADASKDKYPVKDFRYLRLNSRGDNAGTGTDWQSRFVEVDIWATKLVLPSRQPTITAIARNSGGDVTLQWSAISGRTYEVQYKPDLNGTNWIHLDSITAGGNTESILDTATTAPQRHYRVVLQP